MLKAVCVRDPLKAVSECILFVNVKSSVCVCMFFVTVFNPCF
eukprot:UN18824